MDHILAIRNDHEIYNASADDADELGLLIRCALQMHTSEHTLQGEGAFQDDWPFFIENIQRTAAVFSSLCQLAESREVVCHDDKSARLISTFCLASSKSAVSISSTISSRLISACQPNFSF